MIGKASHFIFWAIFGFCAGFGISFLLLGLLFMILGGVIVSLMLKSVFLFLVIEFGLIGLGIFVSEVTIVSLGGKNNVALLFTSFGGVIGGLIIGLMSPQMWITGSS